VIYLTAEQTWIDTGASDVPPSVLAKATGDGPFQRVVSVVRPGTYDHYRRGILVVGRWQEQRGDQWVTLTERRTYADVSTFGRRYQPLEEG
jgi:hypothetical protein